MTPPASPVRVLVTPPAYPPRILITPLVSLGIRRQDLRLFLGIQITSPASPVRVLVTPPCVSSSCSDNASCISCASPCDAGCYSSSSSCTSSCGAPLFTTALSPPSFTLRSSLPTRSLPVLSGPSTYCTACFSIISIVWGSCGEFLLTRTSPLLASFYVRARSVARILPPRTVANRQ